MTDNTTKLTSDEYMPVAREIHRQLGRGFSLITGARNFVGIPEQRGGLMFSLPSGISPKRVNKVRIILNWMDTYTVEFWRVWGDKATLLNTVDDVYCDQLHDVLEDGTGLYTTLQARD